MTVEVRVELYYIISLCTTGYRVYTSRGQVLSNFSTDSCFCAMGTLTVTQFGSMPWFAAFFPLHLQHDNVCFCTGIEKVVVSPCRCCLQGLHSHEGPHAANIYTMQDFKPAWAFLGLGKSQRASCYQTIITPYVKPHVPSMAQASQRILQRVKYVTKLTMLQQLV